MDELLPVLGAPFTWSAWLALALYLTISPGIFIALTTLVERRRFSPPFEFWALAYGDPLLALVIATSILLTAGSLPDAVAPAVTAPWGWLVPVVALGFGFWQWRQEYVAGYYTKEQSLAPSKIYHQIVIYPVLGYGVWTALVTGLATPASSIWSYAGKVILLGLYAGWLGLHLYDRRHPKLGHAPFDWRRLGPVPQPWEAASISLRAPRA